MMSEYPQAMEVNGRLFGKNDDATTLGLMIFVGC
jgi:hypothetical protein